MNKNILIIGGNGYIGQKNQQYFKNRHTGISVYIGSRQQRKSIFSSKRKGDQTAFDVIVKGKKNQLKLVCKIQQGKQT